jgi:hypothetical protein
VPQAKEGFATAAYTLCCDCRKTHISYLIFTIRKIIYLLIVFMDVSAIIFIFISEI